MNKRDLKNIRWMVNDVRHRMWKIECLGHLVQSIAEDEDILSKRDFDTLAIILNENIYRSKKVLIRLDKYFTRMA